MQEEERAFYNRSRDIRLHCPSLMRGPTRSQICSWLRESRDAAGLTRRAVSIEIGVTERVIQKWEDHGQTALPMADKFLALVLLYKADVGELLATKYVRSTANATDRPAGEGKTRRTG